MKGKRILSAVLSAALLLQLSPLAVFAEDTSLLPAAAQTVQTEPAPQEPTAEPVPEPAGAEPTPTAEPTPAAAPTTEPTAEPIAAPAPEETAAPDAAETPAPEPSAEPTAAPDPAAEVQAMIDAQPNEVTEDNAAAVEQALTDIDDAKESLTDEQLAGLDLTRYDAAANALLALRGEAPADAVELLDDIGTKPDLVGEYYQIATPDNLYWFANEVSVKGQTTISAQLTQNITLDKNTQWTPIGTKTKPFAGTFDGGGNTITGLTYTNKNEDYVGLFGYANGATIQNVTVQDATFTGYEYIGGVCGYITGGTITNCHAVNTTIGDSTRNYHPQYCGGIVGYMTGKNVVTNCTNSGTVSGGDYIGGIAGEARDATVQRCFNTGEVTGYDSSIGGIAGQAYNATVQDCGNTGAVIRTGNGGNYGGIVGATYETSAIKNCYNANSTIAYPICVTNPPETTLSNCYYLVDSSGNPNFRLENTTPKTLAEFNSGEVAYLLQSKCAEPTWGQTLTGTNKQDYPTLGGKTVYYNETDGYHNHDDNTVCVGCAPKPTVEIVEGKTWYIITTPDELKWFAKWVKNGHTDANAKLGDNITLNQGVLNDKGELNGTAHDPWTPIGTNTDPFTGTFDGGGNTISGLYIDGNTNNVGLFGVVGANGTVKDVTLADSYVRGNELVGGICGYNKGGTLQNCHNTTGTVSGRNHVGGVCGYNYSGGA